jgi:DNA polymerase-3 subunit delta'
VLILTAPQTADLLPTIVSRCQHLRFKPIAQRHLAAILNKAYGFPEQEASATAAMAHGSVTRALAMHRGQWLLRRGWLMDELEGLPRQPPSVLLALAEKLSQDKPALADVLDLIASWVRDLAVARHAPQAVLHQDVSERIIAAGAAVEPPQFHRAARAVDEARRRIQSNANPRLTLEWLLCKLAEGLDTASRPPAP